MSKRWDFKETSSNDWEDYEGDEEDYEGDEEDYEGDEEDYEDDWEDYEEDEEDIRKRRREDFEIAVIIGSAVLITVGGIGLAGYMAWGFFTNDNGSSGGSYIPKQKIIAVREVTKGGEVGLIGGAKKGPRGFMTAERKKYEVTYEDANGVIRTKTMSSDPTK